MGQASDKEDGRRDWPHHESSRFVSAGGLRWHVQLFDSSIDSATADKPVALLIHGTGASTHSWRGLVSKLSQHFKVLAVDLPGHGLTQSPPAGAASPLFTLPGMARAVGALLDTLKLNPSLLVGHSAGAAIAVRMCLDGWAKPRCVISLNGALLPLGGLAGQFFSPAAKLMAAVPGVPKLFSWFADHPATVQKLIASTGSKLDAEGLALYQKLVSNPSHCAGALAMMANWDLQTLARDLQRVKTPLVLMAGEKDLTVIPDHARQVLLALPPDARLPLVMLPDLGHLAHEEQPEAVADLVHMAYLQNTRPD